MEKKCSLSLSPHHVLVEILRKMNKKTFIDTTKTCGKFAFTSFATEIPLKIPLDKELVIEAIRCQHPTFYIGIEPYVVKLRPDAISTLRMFKFKKVTLIVEKSTYFKQRVEEIKEIIPLKGYRDMLHLDLLEATQEMLELVKDLRPKTCRVKFNESLSKAEMATIMANSPPSFCGQWEVANPGFAWSYKEIIGARETFSFLLNKRSEYWDSYDRLEREWLSGGEIRTKRVNLMTNEPRVEESAAGNEETAYDEYPGKEFYEEFKWYKSFCDIRTRSSPGGILIISRVYRILEKRSESVFFHIESMEAFLNAMDYLMVHLNRPEGVQKLKEEKWRDLLAKTFEHYWKKTQNSAGI